MNILLSPVLISAVSKSPDAADPDLPGGCAAANCGSSVDDRPTLEAAVIPRNEGPAFDVCFADVCFVRHLRFPSGLARCALQSSPTGDAAELLNALAETACVGLACLRRSCRK
jgi:hypothetical protein